MVGAASGEAARSFLGSVGVCAPVVAVVILALDVAVVVNVAAPMVPIIIVAFVIAVVVDVGVPMVPIDIVAFIVPSYRRTGQSEQAND
jgi:hypothetical protein